MAQLGRAWVYGGYIVILLSTSFLILVDITVYATLYVILIKRETVFKDTLHERSKYHPY